MEEQQFSEHDSLRLITEMIQKAKKSFHENGTSAILWGSAVGLAGIINFAELYWHFYIGFDIWLIVMAAVIPQVFISIRESRNRKVITHTEAAMNTIWIVYGISIFALIFYFNVVPGVSDKSLVSEGISLIQKNADGTTRPFHLYPLSHGSLLLLLYAIPTLVTGIAHKFRPMTYAAILCYIFFLISCYTSTAYDMLLNGLAGICNWLIPGLILRRMFYRQKKAMNV
jgi:hypothetical protein